MQRRNTSPLSKDERPAASRASRHDEAVFRVLCTAAAPMSAYAILEAVRPLDITAPTTVYRALSRLTRSGVVHRLESINAYVACRRDGVHGVHGVPAAFAICLDCGHVDELSGLDVARHLLDDAEHLGFRVEKTTIELTGHCSSCAGGRNNT